MMNRPPVNELEQKVGCRYALVTAVAKRARQIMQNPDVDSGIKPVSAAIEELYEEKLKIKNVGE